MTTSRGQCAMTIGAYSTRWTLRPATPKLTTPFKRYRDDIFVDKYKRLAWEEPSRSITAHIARDGYWYIHPEQPRTLTIREAARLQAFPDRVRFAGTPSMAFRQIGNAVPPVLAEQVGTLDPPSPQRVASAKLAQAGRYAALLAGWFDSQESAQIAMA